MATSKPKGGQIKVFNAAALQDLVDSGASNSGTPLASFGQQRSANMSFNQRKLQQSSVSAFENEDRRLAKERHYQQKRDQIEKQRKV